MDTQRSSRLARTTAAAVGLAAAATGLTSAPAQAVTDSGQFFRDRGLVVVTPDTVQTRDADGRQVVLDRGVRSAFGIDAIVVYQARNGQVRARDLENDVRLRSSVGADAQFLLGVGTIDGQPHAIVEDFFAGGQEPDDYRGAVVAIDLLTRERSVLVDDFVSFEAGYRSVHVLPSGDVVALKFDSAATVLQKLRPGRGEPVWSRVVASDQEVSLAGIGRRVSVISTRARGGDHVVAVRRFAATDGTFQNRRTFRTIDAPSYPFCSDWKNRGTLVCQSAEGPFLLDAGGRGEGSSRPVKAPRNAVATVIGGR